MTEHTPGPWFRENNKIWHENGLACIAEVFHGVLGRSDDLSEAQEANARFIVTACNTHTDLLTALECLTAVVHQERWADMETALDDARSAIAKARNS